MVSSRALTSLSTSAGVANGRVYCSSIEPQKQRLSPYSFFSCSGSSTAAVSGQNIQADLNQVGMMGRMFPSE